MLFIKLSLSVLLFVYYRVAQDIELFEGFSEIERVHFKSSLCIEVNKFVVTNKFKKLIENLNSGVENIAIGGPKGVGKSMALGAIATLYHKERKCFLWSPVIEAEDHFKSYVEYIFGKSSMLALPV